MGSFLTKLFGGGIKETIESIGTAVDKIDNSEDKLAIQLQFKNLLIGLEEKAQSIEAQIQLAAANNVFAEIKGESWLQRNWRPITVMMFVGIIFNNYVLVPYLKVPACVLDENIWLIIKISITGYGSERGLKKLGIDLSQILKKK